MRGLVQRVSHAAVRVGDETVAQIGPGLLVLVGIAEGDGDEDLFWLARKIPTLRIFSDDEERMNRSVVDVGGQVLLVSQFTLCADAGKGTRPSFGGAMNPEAAERLFEALTRRVAEDVPVQVGRFGAHMAVELVNDGPVTIWLDSKSRGRG